MKNLMKDVTFVELPVYDMAVPLVSGYLQAYACMDQSIANTFRFHQYSVNYKTSQQKIVGDLLKYDSDVYAFSCYVWNSALIRRVLAELIVRKPHAQFLLGGPQVMFHGQTYLDPTCENLFLCNGEGEKTFAHFLNTLTESLPDFTQVRGLSFYRDGTLLTTPNHDRIRNLNEIPSPYLNGLFQGQYRATIFETNRGCPFSCGFCYWGAANNDKVFNFDTDRIYEELRWISQKHVPLLFIADANWGIFPRDIEFSEQIARNAHNYQAPYVLYFSAAKNKPDKVSQITEIFDRAGIIATQPVSLQTLNPTSLVYIDRENIKLSAYMTMQESLKQKRISTYTELIWPLPGETLASFMDGINTLCKMKAGAIITYSHLLLHNTALYQKQAEYELVTRPVDKEYGEAELVIQTKEVSTQDYKLGLSYYYAVHLLHNMHLLTFVGTYLAHRNLLQYSDLFLAFSEFLTQHPETPIAQLCRGMTDEGNFYAYGETAHYVLHEYRDLCQKLLYQFVSAQSWWCEEEVRLLFELDLLNQPYIYRNTPFTTDNSLFDLVTIIDASDYTYLIEVPEQHLALVEAFVLTEKENDGDSNLCFIDHKRMQYAYIESQGLAQNATYCFGMLIRNQSMLPRWAYLNSADLLEPASESFVA